MKRIEQLALILVLFLCAGVGPAMARGGDVNLLFGQKSLSEDALDDAVRAPRMRSYERGRLALEPGFELLRADLESRGHELVAGDFFGGCQAIESRADGSLRAFSDPRSGGEPRGR